MEHRRSLLSYGFRSGRNVLEGKTIRKHAGGADNFADYWTDTDSEDSSLDDECPPAVEAPVISEASVQARSPRNSLASVQARSPRNSLASVQPRKSKKISLKSVKKNVQNDNPNSPLSQNLVNKSISNTNLSAPDIHVLPSKEVSSPKADLPDGTLSETHSFSDKTSDPNSAVGHNGSNISKISLESHTVINKRSLKMSETFAKYDEYDAEIMQMANDNGNSLNIRRKKYSAKPSCSNKQAQEKAKSNVSKNTNKKIMETTVNGREAENSHTNLSSSKVKQSRLENLRDSRNRELSHKKPVSNNNEKCGLADISNTSLNIHKSPSKNLFSKSFKNLDNLPETSRRNYDKKKGGIKSTVKQKFNETFPASPQKSLTEADKNMTSNESCSETGKEIEAEAVSDPICDLVHVGEIMDKSRLSSKEEYAIESIDKNVNKDNYKNTTETDNSNNIQTNNEAEVETVSHTNQDICISHNGEIKKKTYKTTENLNLRSVTKGKDNPKISKKPVGSPIKNKKHVNKIHENVETSKTFSNENIENVIQSPVKSIEFTPSRVTRSQKVIASETFSKGNTEGVLLIPSTETEITDNHNSKRKGTNKTYENFNPSEADRDHSKKRKQHVSESLPFTNQHTLPSRKKKKLVEKVINTAEEAAFDENAETSKTFTNENIIESPVKRIEVTPNRVSRSQRAIASETVSNDNTEGDFLIPSTETELPSTSSASRINDNHNSKRKSTNKICENLNPSEPDRDHSKKRKQHVSESCESLPITNQHALPSKEEKKLKKKVINTTEEEALIRRSGRQKVKPLERWRNERLLYKNENGCRSIAGVDKGTKLDDYAVQYILRKNIKPVRNKLKTRAPCKIQIKDAQLGRQVKLPLVKRFDTIHWHKDENSPYRIKKVITTNKSVYGIIQIKINEEKPEQYLPDQDIYFTVVKGKVQVSIQDSENELSEMDIFVVPRSVPYSIKNIGTVRAVLNFCVGEFQYIETVLQEGK